MQPKTAIRRARSELRLERQDRPDGETCWMVYDQEGNGRGVYGDELAGQNEYEKRIMFRALELIDPQHDWHDYDWHLLCGHAEGRVQALLARRKECDDAQREVAAWTGLARAMMHQTLRRST